MAGLPASASEIDALAINTIRTLAMDAVQAAESGHPGTPMALAPVAYSLWQRILRYDPTHPHWMDRDRFVLSNGHASMLLYSLIHLAGVPECDQRTGKLTGKQAVPLEDIKRFRQIGSKCPGHPEYGWTTGVETTTGPLGQGCATSVGMAIASRWLATRYNKPGFELFTHRVWTICGDGCMMEGITGEAASLAGHLKLGNLCWIYDSNHITIEGNTSLAYSDDAAMRFSGYGWAVRHVSDANDIDAVASACQSARVASQPTLIIVNSHIGWGAPTKQDTASAHGEALGVEEIKGAKRFYHWPEDAQFLVPEGVVAHFQEGVGARGAELSAKWRDLFAVYSSKYPELAREIQWMNRRELPPGWETDLPGFPVDAKGVATRISGSKVLNAIARRVPWMVGGSADLAPSTKTLIDGSGSVGPESFAGCNMHYGIREHAMGAVCNGMALSGLRSYGAGFLIFSDYMRGSIRLSALMELPVIYVFTHDSIGLGEDGPTHQPIEQLASLRALPGLNVYRPCDANETVACWCEAMRHVHQPSVLALSRQNLPTQSATAALAGEGCARGAYVLSEAPSGAPQVILLASGSEVALCVDAQTALAKEGIQARVVSMPCWEAFDQQSGEYHEQVLPRSIRARVGVEAGSTFGWERYCGNEGGLIGMRSFGASAPIKDLMSHFGFSSAAVVAKAKEQLAYWGKQAKGS
ncbi:MAG: transketolase [Phycisphaerales bacterium]|nr:transketolase [Phycisphaerales bacterium]